MPLLLAAVRTPIGKYLGGLADVSAPELGAVVLREAMRRARLPTEGVDEVILGNVIQAGLGQNPARQAALKAGLPDTIAAFTVNKVCGSGLKAVMLAAQAIKAGDADIILADNLSDDDIRETVRRARGRARVEISGGVTLERIPALAATGADSVSVGALTHSAPAADISFEVDAA